MTSYSSTVASTTSSSSSAIAITSPFRWPTEPTKLGLTEQDIKILEIFIQRLQSQFQLHRPHVPKNGILWGDSPRGRELTLTTGEVVKLPRRLVVYEEPKRVFVVLNSKNGAPTMRGGLDQPTIKLVFEAFSGKKYLKKKIFTPEQELIVQQIFGPMNDSLGFARIGHVERRTKKNKTIAVNYFEQQYHSSISELCRELFLSQKAPPSYDLESLLRMQDGLVMLHQLRYTPPSFFNPQTSITSSFGTASLTWLGDISPNNTVFDLNSEGRLELRFIDYGHSLCRETVASLPGWESPEMFKMSLDTSVARNQFNDRYALKKDAWQFGLLLGSMLRGGPIFDPNLQTTLPRFSFILNRIFKLDGTFNPSGLKDLTQEEVDENILKIKKDCAPKSTLLTMWEVISKWLTVDPDQRPSVAECHITWLSTRSEKSEKKMAGL